MLKPLIHIKAETLAVIYPVFAQIYQNMNESLTVEKDSVDLSVSDFLHIVNSNTQTLLIVSEVCSEIENDNEQFTKGELVRVYLEELLEDVSLDDIEFPSSESSQEFTDIVYQWDLDELNDIYEYSNNVHPSFAFIDITKDVRKALRSSPHLYFEFLSKSISDTSPRETYSELLTSIVANYSYNEDRLSYRPYSDYSEQLNEKLWLKLHGNKSFRLPSEILKTCFEQLGENDAYADQIKNINLEEFKHLVATNPALTRLIYIGFCRLNYINAHRWDSKGELKAFFSAGGSLEPIQSHDGDVIVALEGEPLDEMQSFLLAHTVQSSHFENMANVIEFAKNNFDLYLEFLIDDKTKMLESFIGRAIRLAI